MHDDEQLAQGLVASDFFGPEGLGEETVLPGPERYPIVRHLGRGGGGSVYLARDRQLGRLVALKFLRHSRPAELERFFREARFAARLNNPSIVQIYEAGESDGLPFIVMQYIDGGSLATADLEIPAAVRVMRQVGAALAHAHREGIVHRDIKPENILLDANGHAYVTDFGIARDLRGELGATISQEGQILGTPGLMPPEQARGHAQAVDARSDIYALGATLYYKVTRHTPFSADNLVDMLHAVIHDDPPFPRRYRADVPRDLEAVILRCMRKRREERYGSMDEVVAALDRVMSGRRATLSPIWFTSYVRSQVEEAPPVEVPVAEPERDWLPALEVAQEIAAWDTQLYRVRGDLTRHFPRLDALIARLDRVLEEQPATGWARFYRGVAWFRRGDLDRAREDMERAIDRVRDLGSAYFELGRLYLAIYLCEHQTAQRHLSRLGTDEHLRLAQGRLEQASLAFEEARRLKQDLPAWQIRYAEAVGSLAAGDVTACAAACNEILGEDPDLEEVWKLKGDALRAQGSDPLPAYERAIDIRRSYYEPWLAMAEVHLEASRPAEARDCLTRALEVHRGLVPARVMLARTYLQELRDDGAPALLEAGLAHAEEAVAAQPNRYEAAVTLAELQIARGRISADTGWFTKALGTLQRAEVLEGCQNRVGYLQLTTYLARARAAAGTSADDARRDLRAILALRDYEAARVPDNRRWLDLFAAAEQALAELDANAPC